MTKFLYHGENIVESRKNLRQNISDFQKKGFEIRVVDGQKVTLPDLESFITTTNLFGEEVIVIENLGSRILSNEKKKLILLIKNFQDNKPIILWEKKELTKTQINAFGSDIKAVVSKSPAIIFKLLDSLSPSNLKSSISIFHDALNEVEDGFIFVMLSRHIADLIIAKSGDTTKLNPWKKGKLIVQAENWDNLTLLSVHDSLLEIDRAIKTGNTKLAYRDHLDLLLVSLLE